MNLERAKQLATELLAALNDAPAEPPPADPEAPFGRNLAGEPNFAPAYDACRGMWEAAQRAGAFSIWTYVGPGIQSYAGQLVNPPKADLQALEDAIVALGLSPWGQAWLVHAENRALVAPAYCRRFGAKPVERKADGSLHEYE
jgi:hypothetical protein